MKNLNLIVLFLATLFFSCDKDKNQPESYVGKWELRHVLGVQVANSPDTFEKGNGNIVELSADNYKNIVDGVVVTEGTYTIEKESTEIDGTKFENSVTFGNENRKAFIKLSGNKLLICYGPTASDGYTNTYERL